ncbi:MAG: aminoacyl-tRNA hydrolase, partial [Pseudomonadota bacterium]|nr:aminoacyl-tRNA hydrolase [Pseudomonadota bacterium]
INNQKIFVLKPLTFMNLSGKAVSEIVNFYKIKINHTFVIHDDLDLELSKVKIKQGGGNGGHNGLESIDQFIGENYFRIRIGIDHPGWAGWLICGHQRRQTGHPGRGRHGDHWSIDV